MLALLMPIKDKMKEKGVSVPIPYIESLDLCDPDQNVIIRALIETGKM